MTIIIKFNLYLLLTRYMYYKNVIILFSQLLSYLIFDILISNVFKKQLAKLNVLYVL